jgi:hypothetical protein
VAEIHDINLFKSQDVDSAIHPFNWSVERAAVIITQWPTAVEDSEWIVTSIMRVIFNILPALLKTRYVTSQWHNRSATRRKPIARLYCMTMSSIEIALVHLLPPSQLNFDLITRYGVELQIKGWPTEAHLERLGLQRQLGTSHVGLYCAHVNARTPGDGCLTRLKAAIPSGPHQIDQVIP